jgi:hypothetical protein
MTLKECRAAVLGARFGDWFNSIYIVAIISLGAVSFYLQNSRLSKIGLLTAVFVLLWQSINIPVR